MKRIKPEMFDQKSMRERIGALKKSDTLKPLEEVEKYFLERLQDYGFTASYDVIANELPFFKTLNYTEYAHCLIIHPLNQELRLEQMRDAWADNAPCTLDFVSFFSNKVLEGTASKYQLKQDKQYPSRKNIVVLAGSNKLQERICLFKLKEAFHRSKGDIWYKPHPITTHQVIGKLKDILGEDNILPREANLYQYLRDAQTVYTSHISESACYAVSLGKAIEPTDDYHREEQGSFYHINRFLFRSNQPQAWINRTFNSPKSGIINPHIDPDWKTKVDAYLKYIDSVREGFRGKYLDREPKPEEC